MRSRSLPINYSHFVLSLFHAIILQVIQCSFFLGGCCDHFNILLFANSQQDDHDTVVLCSLYNVYVKEINSLGICLCVCVECYSCSMIMKYKQEFL